jgi:transposase
MSETAVPAEIIVGVDTHKHVHTAVAIDALGTRQGSTTVPVSAEGYRALEAWARSFGSIRAFGVEGTGSYGAGLSRFLCEQGHSVLEIDRPSRRLRQRKGKSEPSASGTSGPDPLDAEAAARAVLGGQAIGLPKSGTGAAEMIRHLKAARDTAMKARTQAMLTLKALIVGAPSALRERLEHIVGRTALIRHLATLRPGPIDSTEASAKAGLRALARRWLALDDEIRNHDVHLDRLTRLSAPELVEAHGMGAGTAAEMLLLVGDNPERIRSEGAFAKLCGACPIPASSGKTNRHRLNRGGDRRANAALHRVVVVRMRRHRPTLDYVRRRTAEGKSTREIIRCLKRFVAREIYGYLCRPSEAAASMREPA